MVLGSCYSTLDKADKDLGMSVGGKGDRFEKYIVSKISKLQLRQKIQEEVTF